MKLLALKIDSLSAKILADKLTDELIKDLYINIDSHVVIYDNDTNYKNIVILESSNHNSVRIAAYAEIQVQKWDIYTDTPVSLSRRLVQKLGLKCESGIHDCLFG